MLTRFQCYFIKREITLKWQIIWINENALNEGRLVGSVMVDFQKAFDMVDHEIMLKKLSLYRCSSLTLSWFRCYLSNRSQTVSINGVYSETDTVLCCVPQGSILGPLLFLLFINDLPLILKNVVSATDLYADDKTIYDVQTDKATPNANLQTALNLLKTWCRENSMLLNTDKTKVMLLTSRQKRTTFTGKVLSLNFNNVELQLSNTEKVLGVYIDENFIWNTHFTYVSKKVSSNLWLLSQIKNYLSLEHRLIFYNAYIKTHFDYCSIVWGNSTKNNINKINKLQRRACKLILDKEYTCLEEARNRLKILSFDESVFLQKAKTMYKIANKIALKYLIDLFQIRNTYANSTTSNLQSVSNRNFIIPKPNINLFKNSISYSGTIIWNSIPLEIKNADSINSFVNRCVAWIKN